MLRHFSFKLSFRSPHHYNHQSNIQQSNIYPTNILCTTADIFLGLSTVLKIMEIFLILTLEKCVNVNKKKYFHILEISSLDHAV